MAQNREKEETELTVPGNLTLCSPPWEIPSQLSPSIPAAARSSPDRADQKLAITFDHGERSPREAVNRGVLKRPREVTRCSGPGCRKRIGFMAFRCRCGEVFCPEHRYSDRHDCIYDYKAAGREAIARENPIVRASKLLRV